MRYSKGWPLRGDGVENHDDESAVQKTRVPRKDKSATTPHILDQEEGDYS